MPVRVTEKNKRRSRKSSPVLGVPKAIGILFVALLILFFDRWVEVSKFQDDPF